MNSNTLMKNIRRLFVVVLSGYVAYILVGFLTPVRIEYNYNRIQLPSYLSLVNKQCVGFGGDALPECSYTYGTTVNNRSSVSKDIEDSLRGRGFTVVEPPPSLIYHYALKKNLPKPVYLADNQELHTIPGAGFKASNSHITVEVVLPEPEGQDLQAINLLHDISIADKLSKLSNAPVSHISILVRGNLLF